jgi:hypothetical protein
MVDNKADESSALLELAHSLKNCSRVSGEGNHFGAENATNTIMHESLGIITDISTPLESTTQSR